MKKRFKAFIPKVQRKTGLVSSDLRALATSIVNKELKKSKGLSLQLNSATKKRMIDNKAMELFYAKMRHKGQRSI